MKRYRDSKGFTLVEILIALALMSIITTAIYQLYISNYKTWVSQDLVTEMQQNARFSIDLMTREMQLAGYDIPSGETAIKEATDTKFTFWSRDLSISGAANEQRRKVSFYQDGANLKMDVVTEAGGADTGNVVAENVESLDFDYYDDQNNQITSLPADMGLIRRIKVTLKVRTSRKDPITLDYKRMALVTELRPRNLGIGEVITDITPPAVPTGIEVVDPGKCGKLWVRWTPNSEVDLAGYVIYYGQSTGSYTGQVSVSTSAPQPYYELGGLTVSPSNANGTTVPYVSYYIAIAAFDTSGNISGYSTEVSGNPVPSTRAFGGANDTTINIEKPSAPTILKGQDAAANQIKLTWSASVDPNNNIKGYRLYRSTSNFTTFPIVAEGTNIVQVADENTISAGITSYTDTGPGLLGCTVYYYALAPITCDTTLMTKDSVGDTVYYAESDYGITYGDGTTGSPAGSDTAPKDGVPPGTPVISKRADGTIVSGYKRAYITITNPSDADFDHTRIYYSTTATPTVDTNPNSPTYGVVSGGNPVPDTNVLPKGIKGRLEGAGTTVSFVHDSEYTASIEDVNTMHAPQLEGAQYYYLAVAYDKCGNPRADTAAATTLASLCGDGNPGDPEYGAPDAPTGASVSGCSTSMIATWNPITASASQNPDAAGYRIYRTPAASFDTSLDPSSLDGTSCKTSPNTACYLGFVPIGSPTTFSDGPIYGLADGGVYSYGIVSTDCVYENRWCGLGEAAYKFNNSKYKQGWLTKNGVMPGSIKREDQHKEVLTRDSTWTGIPSTDPTKGYHNKVRLYFRNTGQGTMTINSISNIQWSKSSARLTKVSIGGNEYTTCPIVYNTSPTPPVVWTATGTPGPSSPTSIPLTGGVQIGGSCLNVPINLEFSDVNGLVKEGTDMRGDNVRLTLDVRNDSTNTTTCSSYVTVTQLDEAIPVDKGPTFDTSGDSVDDVALPGPITLLTPAPSQLTVVPPSGVTTDPVKVLKDGDIEVKAQVMSQDIPAKNVCAVNLYWKETSLKPPTTTPLSSFNTLAMNYDGGNLYKVNIPNNKGKRVWFYIVAADDHDGNCGTTGDRNFDRSPEVQSGYYVYDQNGDPCTTTPEKPAGLTLSNSPSVDVDASGNVNLQWTAPSTNTDTTTILDLAGFNLYEYYSNDKGATWTSASGNPVAHIAGTTAGGTYTYPRSASSYSTGTWLNYKVSAYDSCTPNTTPYTDKESALSTESGTVIKGTCANVPGTTDVITTSPDSTTSGGYIQTISWNIPTDTDKDLKGFVIYGRSPTSPTSATTDTNYWKRATVDISAGCSCTAIIGSGCSCSIAGSKVTVTAPSNTWDASNPASVRAFDYCGKYGNRGTEW